MVIKDGPVNRIKRLKLCCVLNSHIHIYENGFWDFCLVLCCIETPWVVPLFRMCSVGLLQAPDYKYKMISFAIVFYAVINFKAHFSCTCEVRTSLGGFISQWLCMFFSLEKKNIWTGGTLQSVFYDPIKGEILYSSLQQEHTEQAVCSLAVCLCVCVTLTFQITKYNLIFDK